MTLADARTLPGGFHDPVFDSQHAFRAAMEALANPGRIRPAGRGLEGSPLPAAASSLALALCDYETTLYLAPSIAERAGVAEHLRFYTDAVLVADPSLAAFAILDPARDRLDLASFAQGSAEYPDRSTTLIIITTSLTEGAALLLSGPGIAKKAELKVTGLPEDFVTQWHSNRARFPLGVDILFATSDAIVGLPRSTRLLKEPG